MNRLQIIVKPLPNDDPQAAFVARYDDKNHNWTLTAWPATQGAVFGSLAEMLESPAIPRIVRAAIREFLAVAGLVEWPQ